VDSYRGDFVGQAHFSGGIAVFNRPRVEVEAFLPSGLELLWNTSSAPELHPVAFLFGDQVDGTTIFGGAPMPLGIEYPETCLAVPFVRGKGGRYRQTFVPHMATNFEPAAWSGNHFYGFAKELTAFEGRGSALGLVDAHGHSRLRAGLEPTGEWQPAAGFASAPFEDVRTMFRLPMLGRKPEGEDFIASYFEFDFSEAQVRPAAAWLEIVEPLAPGIEAGTWHSVPEGGFEVQRMRWRVSWPQPYRP
jgi:hypothetical protein